MTHTCIDWHLAGEPSKLEREYITTLYRWLCPRVKEREWNHWELRLQPMLHGNSIKPHIVIDYDKCQITIMMDMLNAMVRVVSEGRFRSDYDRQVKFELADPACFEQVLEFVEGL